SSATVPTRRPSEPSSGRGSPHTCPARPRCPRTRWSAVGSSAPGSASSQRAAGSASSGHGSTAAAPRRLRSRSSSPRRWRAGRRLWGAGPAAPKHRGRSCLVVDMRSPGVTWRPLVQISRRRDFNELFLEEVRVPAANVVGPVNGGWPIIRTALAHERGTLWAFDFKVRLQNGSRALADLYRRCRTRGRADLAAFRPLVAQAWIAVDVVGAVWLTILMQIFSSV